MTSKERIREIAGKDPRALTDEDKKYIREMSDEMGIAFSPRKRCANCYIDQAISIWREMAKQDTSEERKFLLVPGTDVLFRGQRVNDATLTDEVAAELLAKGFPKYLFARYVETEEK